MKKVSLWNSYRGTDSLNAANERLSWCKVSQVLQTLVAENADNIISETSFQQKGLQKKTLGNF